MPFVSFLSFICFIICSVQVPCLLTYYQHPMWKHCEPSWSRAALVQLWIKPQKLHWDSMKWELQDDNVARVALGQANIQDQDQTRSLVLWGSGFTSYRPITTAINYIYLWYYSNSLCTVDHYQPIRLCTWKMITNCIKIFTSFQFMSFYQSS